MKLTAQEEYGLRCLVQVARAGEETPATIAQIAEWENLSVPYVGKLMRHLRQAGLVTSTRGQHGGYALALAADALSLSDVIDALGERLMTGCSCDRFTGQGPECVHDDECALRALWAGVDRLTHAYLSTWTLADLLRPERALTRRARERMKGAVAAFTRRS